MYHHLPEEGDELVSKRFQIINVGTPPQCFPLLLTHPLQVWRPIKTIYKDPLGVASAQSVPDSDLVGAALIYPTRKGETYTVKPNPKHEWFYKYAQRPDEVTLIKCFDSKTDGRARRVPHSAFTNPEEEHKDGRESIEVRALVFYAE